MKLFLPYTLEEVEYRGFSTALKLLHGTSGHSLIFIYGGMYTSLSISLTISNTSTTW
jgi:hypothetical protein